jgi:hypothetical protein
MPLQPHWFHPPLPALAPMEPPLPQFLPPNKPTRRPLRPTQAIHFMIVASFWSYGNISK